MGILIKLCLQINLFRRELSTDTNIYYLLIRALLIFHDNLIFKLDCSMVIFLLLFNDYIIVENNKQQIIKLPFLLKKLHIPFKCDFHWKLSPFKIDNKLNELINDNNTIANIDNKWQYLRITFAKLWFNDFYNINKMCKENEFSSSILFDDINFDNKLKLTKLDLKLIESTKISNYINCNLSEISNGTKHKDIHVGLSRLENAILIFNDLNSNENNVMELLNQRINLQKQLPTDQIINTLKRFCMSAPNNYADDIIFKNTLNFIGKLIERGLFVYYL